MATTVSSLFTGDTCFPYTVIVEKSFFDSDPLISGIAFLIGAIVGGLFGVCCAYFCLKDITRHKEKEVYMNNEKGPGYKQKVTILEPTKVGPSPDDEVKVSMKRKKSSKKRRPGTAKGDEALTPIALVSLGENENTNTNKGQGKSLADVLLQSTKAGMDAELSAQDLESITDLDNEQRGENINTMVQMLRVLLQQQLQKGTINENDFQNMMKGIQSDISDVLSTAGREKAEQEEELRKKHEKDPDKLDEELEKLQSKHMSRINSLLGDTTEKIRKDIKKNTRLSDDALEAMMAELHYNMAESERKLGDERTRQTMALQERLAKRKQLAEMHKNLKDQQEKDIVVRCDTHNDTLSQLVDNGKMVDRQREDLVNAYEDDQRNIYMKHKEQMQKQELQLADKLRARRDKKLAQLAEKQELEREDFLNKADASTNTDSVRESFHKLTVSQREEKADLVDALDDEEAEKFRELLKATDKEMKDELQQTDERFADALQDRAQLSEQDADKIMRIYDAQMEEHERNKKAERKRMQAKMMEKLEQRKQTVEEEIMLAQAEQQNLVDQQTNTVQKVLKTHVDMTEEAKEKILREHEQHMNRVNNQLQMSKLRQEKALEQRLNKRRARVAELKEQKEQALSEARNDKAKEKTKLAEQLEKQIKDEEKKLEDMKKKQVADLRRTLAEETAEALNEQEKRLGLLIARLEVGAARRQAIIAKQDKTIKELESKMVNKVAEDHGAELEKDRRVDQIIIQHTREVEQLEDKLQSTRDRQEESLQQKLLAKKQRRQKEMEREINEEVHEELEQQERQGAGLASSILTRVMMDQRHKMAMEQLAKEMQLEMQKQREELNKELEVDIQKELQEQKKSFLAQLATISNMSKDEINEVVENAVNDAGGDEVDAKRLTKEFKNEMKRAKSELGEDRSEYSDYRRTRSDMYDDNTGSMSLKPRPKSGRRPPRDAFDERDDYGY